MAGNQCAREENPNNCGSWTLENKHIVGSGQIDNGHIEGRAACLGMRRKGLRLVKSQPRPGLLQRDDTAWLIIEMVDMQSIFLWTVHGDGHMLERGGKALKIKRGDAAGRIDFKTEKIAVACASPCPCRSLQLVDVYPTRLAVGCGAAPWPRKNCVCSAFKWI